MKELRYIWDKEVNLCWVYTKICIRQRNQTHVVIEQRGCPFNDKRWELAPLWTHVSAAGCSAALVGFQAWLGSLAEDREAMSKEAKPPRPGAWAKKSCRDAVLGTGAQVPAMGALQGPLWGAAGLPVLASWSRLAPTDPLRAWLRPQPRWWHPWENTFKKGQKTLDRGWGFAASQGQPTTDTFTKERRGY